MFDGNHNIIWHQVGDIWNQFVLILAKKWETLVSSFVASDRDHEDADEGGDREYCIGGDKQKTKQISEDGEQILLGYFNIEEVINDSRRVLF